MKFISVIVSSLIVAKAAFLLFGSNTVQAFADTVGRTELISLTNNYEQANAGSGYGTTSADARYVAFFSYATNLVSPDTNNHLDLFIYDRSNLKVERISNGLGGIEANGPVGGWGPAMSSDGRSWLLYHGQVIW